MDEYFAVKPLNPIDVIKSKVKICHDSDCPEYEEIHDMNATILWCRKYDLETIAQKLAT